MFFETKRVTWVQGRAIISTALDTTAWAQGAYAQRTWEIFKSKAIILPPKANSVLVRLRGTVDAVLTYEMYAGRFESEPRRVTTAPDAVIGNMVASMGGAYMDEAVPETKWIKDIYTSEIDGEDMMTVLGWDCMGCNLIYPLITALTAGTIYVDYTFV